MSMNREVCREAQATGVDNGPRSHGGKRKRAQQYRDKTMGNPEQSSVKKLRRDTT